MEYEEDCGVLVDNLKQCPNLEKVTFDYFPMNIVAKSEEYWSRLASMKIDFDIEAMGTFGRGREHEFPRDLGRFWTLQGGQSIW